jgi:hypothetical protein
MRHIGLFLFGVAITVLTDCNRQSGNAQASLLPTPVSRPSVSVWDVTTTLSGTTSADPCFGQPGLGTSRPVTISVIRTDDRVAFVVDTATPPDEQLSETGTVAGNEFTASTDATPTTASCPDGTVLRGTFETNLSGRFSDDGRHLTAKETVTYHFSSGESTLRFDWSGVER